MKAHPKHIDWGKVIATNEIMDGYVMPKYGNKNLLEDNSWIDIIMDDVYDTFYRDEEEEEKVAKASKDMKLFIMNEKFLAMVESENARVKDYTKLVVTDGMVDYGKRKLVEDNKEGKEAEHHHLKVNKDDKGKRKLVEDNKEGKEAEHHHLKVNKDDKGKGKLVEDNRKGNVHDIQNRVGSFEVDLARAIKAKQVDDHDDDDLDSLDLANRIIKLEEDFAMEAELKAKDTKKAKEAELKAKKAKEENEAMLEKLKAKKVKNDKEAMLAEVIHISSDKDDDEDPTASASTRSKAPTASTSTRSIAPIAFTSNAQTASTALRGDMLIPPLYLPTIKAKHFLISSFTSNHSRKKACRTRAGVLRNINQTINTLATQRKHNFLDHCDNRYGASIFGLSCLQVQILIATLAGAACINKKSVAVISRCPMMINGHGLTRVVASDPTYRKKDIVSGMLNWAEYTTVKAETC
uniref:Uncharacterized protein n=1 Tax=Tanacetum cinerariifolium TaxID=118510 RepID=A0A6L2JEJ2_TANCI|nr:hypothetical protein [Tanacetum cinerariifolium]